MNAEHEGARRIWAVWRERPGAWSLSLGLGLARSGAALAAPWLHQQLFDTALPSGDGALLGLTLAALVLAGLGTAALGLLEEAADATACAAHDFSLRSRFLRHLLSLPLAWFDTRSLGDGQQLWTDTAQAGDGIRALALDGWRQGLTLAAYLPLLFWLSWPLALLRLVSLPLHQALGRLFAPRDLRLEQALWDESGRLQTRFAELWQGIRTWKAFTREPEGHRRLARPLVGWRRLSWARRLWQGGWSLSGTTLDQVLTAAGLFVAALLIGSGQLSFGRFLAFQGVGALALESLDRFWGAWRLRLQTRNARQRWGEAAATPGELAAPEEPSPSGEAARGVEPCRRGGVSGSGGRFGTGGGAGEAGGGARGAARAPALEAQELWFGYAPGAPVLRGLTFTLPGGSFTALVGPSGSGKSTLLQLLLRHYDPWSGDLSLEGTSLNRLAPREWRARIALVPQDSFFFEGTVGDNLTLGRPTAPAALTQALAWAQAQEFGDPDRRLGPGGAGLSGGQRQRLALARAFLRDAPVLLLDEATSALDAANELRIARILERLRRGRTCVAVAHRLATIRRADQILVMEEGQIRARGRHEELLVRDALYRQLWEAQQGSHRPGTGAGARAIARGGL